MFPVIVTFGSQWKKKKTGRKNPISNLKECLNCGFFSDCYSECCSRGTCNLLLLKLNAIYWYERQIQTCTCIPSTDGNVFIVASWRVSLTSNWLCLVFICRYGTWLLWCPEVCGPNGSHREALFTKLWRAHGGTRTWKRERAKIIRQYRCHLDNI